MNYQRYCSSCGAPHNNMAFKCSICQQTEAILAAQKQAEKERSYAAAVEQKQRAIEEYYRNRYPTTYKPSTNPLPAPKQETELQKLIWDFVGIFWVLFALVLGISPFIWFFWYIYTRSN